MTGAEVARAYAECERITREQARNFSWGIRLLPEPKRHALSAVYAFARRVDDIGDGSLPDAAKLRLLADARAQSAHPGAHPDDPVLVALRDASSRLPIPLGAFGELVDGCEMDVTGVRYDDLDALVTYCRCVAGSIGRLSLGVFAPSLPPADQAEAARLADALGVALQLTNILRDIREDLTFGRVYLPAKDLELFGVRLEIGSDGALDPCGGALAELVRFEAARAWGWYDRGLALLDVLDRRSAACCAAMAGIYLELLERMVADPRQMMAARMSLPTSVKLRVAGRSLLGAGGVVADGSTQAEADVVVVGGGLAGMTAALHCADHGMRVTLLEGRPRLGGAAFSFRRGGLSIDNGQHVFLRCCEAYRWFLDRIGATGRTTLQRRLDIEVLRPDGRSARLRRTPGIPAPGHLTAALSGYGLLSPLDRVRAIRGALALRLLDPADARLDERTLGDFLHRHGQSDAVIEALWGVVAVATLNIDPAQASLALAAKVFRTGLLDHAPAADVGYARAPLGELHDGAARDALERAGVVVRTGARVESVGADRKIQVRDRVGTHMVAPEQVVLAVPPRDAFRIAPELAGTGAAGARELGTSPIVNVHVVYDRLVAEFPFAAAVGSPVQWIFDRTASSGLAGNRPDAQYLAVTISAADEVVDTPSPVLAQRFVAELGRLLPGARSARVLDTFVTRERHATFRQQPRTARLRPGAGAGLDGVWLAGAWTDTGWPDTMESAVRSGVRAAEAALHVDRFDQMRFAS